MAAGVATFAACNLCTAPIFQLPASDALCFFDQDGKALHLIIRPEALARGSNQPDAAGSQLQIVVPSRPPSTIPIQKKLKRRKGIDILCPSCGESIGGSAPVGPDGSDAYCFKYATVRVPWESPLPKPSKGTWASAWQSGVLDMPAALDAGFLLRNANTFNPDSNDRWESDVATRSAPLIRPGLVMNKGHLAPPRDSRDKWCGGKLPKDYQVELFLRGLTRDSIIYLPTGKGKTLVAAMILKRMADINPTRHGVFLVDRVPLVYQQAERLFEDTGLQIFTLCGENASPKNVRRAFQIPNGSEAAQRVVVVTVGCYINLLNRRSTSISDVHTMIFDEVHHAASKTAGHAFNEVIRQIQSTPQPMRPAVIGLTASPGTGKTVADLLSNVERLQTALGGAELAVASASLQMVHEAPPLEMVMFETSQSEKTFDLQMRQHFMDVVEEFEKVEKQLILASANESAIGVPSPPQMAVLFRMLNSADEYESEFPRSTEESSAALRRRRVIAEYLVRFVGLWRFAEIEGSDSTVRRINYFIDAQEPSVLSILGGKITQLRHHLRQASCTKTSSKTEALQEQLDRFMASLSDQSRSMDIRVLIFVQERWEAYALADALKKFNSVKALRPTAIVGQGSYDGMNWSDQQKPVLNDFKCGRTKLVVATSVLEEGLDVQACNLVIHFHPPKSMTSYLQSRGRARHREARFLVLASLAQKASVEKMIFRESMMNMLLPEVKNKTLKEAELLSTAVCQWLKFFCRADNEHEQGPVTELPTNDADKQSLIEVAMKVEGLPRGITLEAIQDHFAPFSAVVVDADSSSGVVHLKLPPATPASWFDDLTSGQRNPFRLSSSHSLRFSLLKLKIPKAQTHFSGLNRSAGWGFVPVESVDRGYFRNGSTFAIIPELLDAKRGSQIAWSFGTTGVRFSFGDASEWFFGLDAIYPEILLDYRSGNGPFTVYLAFLQAPKVIHNFGETSSRGVPHCGEGPWIIRITLTLPEADGPSSIRDILKFLPVMEVFHCRVDVIKESFTTSSTTNLSSLHMEVASELIAVWSRLSPILPTAIPQRLVYVLKDADHDRVLSTLRAKGTFKPFADPVDSFVAASRSLSQAIPTPNPPALPNHIYVRHQIITPSRIVIWKPQYLQLSRALRNIDPELFVLVRFRDEDFGRLNVAELALAKRIETILRHGFTNSDGRQLQFVCCTNSGQKSATAWFTTSNPEIVIEKLGNFAKAASNKYKLLSRLGLSFASSQPTLKIPLDLMQKPQWIPDITCLNGTNEMVYSDGIGMMSLDVADRISKHLTLPYTPTAFQCRIGGFKGVLSVDYRLTTDAPTIRFRGSMHKFDSDFNILEVLNKSADLPVFLNRQIIVILNSLGISDDTFLELQKEHIAQIRTDLWNMESQFPWKQLNIDVAGLKSAGFQVLQDDFFRQLLHATYIELFSGLVKRSRIVVSRGRTLMGVLDESMTLKQGEVFVACSEFQGGPVLVHRNPSTHPGDLRVLQAVHLSHLPSHFSKYSEVVVFPAATGARPHTDECANGDLDGDLYCIIWDERLIPKVTVPALDLPQEEKRTIHQDPPIDLPEAFVKCLESDSKLARIALAHLARSDAEPDGVLSMESIELAKAHAVQVDFRKTGENAFVSEKLMPEEYPHFMERGQYKTYHSVKALGKLFDEGQKWCEHLAMAGAESTSGNHLDPDLILPGATSAFGEVIAELYSSYASTFHAILEAAEAETDAQVLIGGLFRSDELYGESMQTVRSATEMANALRREYAKRFEDLVEDEDYTMKLFAASEWYRYAYAQSRHSERFLSFAWIPIDYLKVIKSQSRTQQPSPLNFDRLLGQTCWAHFQSHHFADLAEFQTREGVRSDLEFDFQSSISGVQVLMFGSSAIPGFPQENHSDLDLCLVQRDVNGNLMKVPIDDSPLLLAKATEALKSAGYSAEFVNASVPLIRVDESRVPIDIVADPTGLWKAELLKKYLFPTGSDCGLAIYVAVYSLLRWARLNGLVGHQGPDGSRTGLFSSFGFCLTVLTHLVQEGLLQPIDPTCIATAPLNPASGPLSMQLRSVRVPTNDETELTGRLILSFLNGVEKTLKADNGLDAEAPCFRIMDPFGPINSTPYRESVHLDASGVVQVRHACERFLHALAAQFGDYAAALRIGKQRIVLRFPLATYPAERFDLDTAVEFFAKVLMARANVTADEAKVEPISRGANKKNQGTLAMEVSGYGYAVERIEAAFKQIVDESRRLSFRRRKRHALGSALHMFEGAVSDLAVVGFRTYHGMYQEAHVRCIRHRPALISPISGDYWKQHAQNKLQTTLLSQLSRLSQSIVPESSLEIAITFGSEYLLNLPRSFSIESLKNATIRDLEAAVIANRAAARPWERDRETAASRSALEEKWRAALDSDADSGGERDEKDEERDIGFAGGNGDKRPRFSRTKTNMQRAKTGMSSAFFAQIKLPSSIIQEELVRLGFNPYQPAKKGHAFTVQVRARNGEEYEYKLDNNLRILDGHEQALRWVSATLVLVGENEDHMNEDAIPDIRLYVNEYRPLSDDPKFHPSRLIVNKLDRNLPEINISVPLKPQIMAPPECTGSLGRVYKVRQCSDVHFASDSIHDGLRWCAKVRQIRTLDLPDDDGSFSRETEHVELKLYVDGLKDHPSLATGGVVDGISSAFFSLGYEMSVALRQRLIMSPWS